MHVNPFDLFFSKKQVCGLFFLLLRFIEMVANRSDEKVEEKERPDKDEHDEVGSYIVVVVEGGAR